MYKRTKGHTKPAPKGPTNEDAVDRVLELMDGRACAMSLVASPTTRVRELKAIFAAEYPLLDFAAHDAASGLLDAAGVGVAHVLRDAASGLLDAAGVGVAHVLRDEDEAEREERREEDDGVQRALELAGERAQVQGA